MSGPVSDTNAFDSIHFGIIDSTNSDSMKEQPAGVTLSYTGSRSGDYVEMLIYCSEEEFNFSNSYQEHTDLKSGSQYSQMTMNSKHGC